MFSTDWLEPKVVQEQKKLFNNMHLDCLDSAQAVPSESVGRRRWQFRNREWYSVQKSSGVLIFKDKVSRKVLLACLRALTALFLCTVFSPAYIRHVGFASLQHWYSFDVGIGWSLKLWCCHKPRPYHAHPTCLHFCLWRALLYEIQDPVDWAFSCYLSCLRNSV